jgi:hypothetical protein
MATPWVVGRHVLADFGGSAFRGRGDLDRTWCLVD